jgi:hypothetical protein
MFEREYILLINLMQKLFFFIFMLLSKRSMLLDGGSNSLMELKTDSDCESSLIVVSPQPKQCNFFGLIYKSKKILLNI